MSDQLELLPELVAACTRTGRLVHACPRDGRRALCGVLVHDFVPPWYATHPTIVGTCDRCRELGADAELLAAALAAAGQV